MTTVYVTRGRKYHADKTCRLMTAGEDLWDFDGEDWSWTAGSYRQTVASPENAARCGKLPCLSCVPATDRTFPPLYGQTFGHQPVTGISLSGVADTVCDRCTEHGVWWGNATELRSVHIPWPCTTAVVLGLAPRATT